MLQLLKILKVPIMTHDSHAGLMCIAQNETNI